MSFQGDLDTVGLATIFQNLVASQQSGVLRVKDETSRRLIVFEAGAIRAVTSGEREQAALGEILVSRGTVSEETLAAALLSQRRTGALLGETLVQMGACTEEAIQDALRFQMEEQVYDLFMWRGARFRFEEGPVPEEEIPPELQHRRVRLNTSGLLLEAMRRLDEWERIRMLLPSFDFIPRLAPDFETTAAADEALPPETKRILACVDGTNAVEAIIRRSALGRYRVTQALADLMERGLVREATPEEMRARAGELVLKGSLESAAAIERRILAVDPEDAETRRAYASLLETREQPVEAAAEYARLAEVLAAREETTAAAEAAGRAALLQPRDRAHQERAAALATAAGHSAQAAAATRNLATLLDEAGETHASLARIDGALARDEENIELLQVRARLLNKLGETEAAAHAYQRLAELHAARGADGAAARACQQVLRLDPANIRAAQHLRELASDATRRGHRRRLTRLALPLALGLLLLAGTLFGLDRVMQHRFERALAHARALVAAAEEGDPDTLGDLLRRIETLEETLQTLKTLPAPGPFGFRNAGEARADLAAATRDALAAARAQRDARLESQARVLEAWARWREHPGAEREAALAALRTLAAEETPTEPVRQARTLLASWERVVAGQAAGIAEAGRILADTARPVRERFQAFQAFRQDPAALRRLLAARPDATLPVRIEALSNTGAPLPATVRVNGTDTGRTLPGVIEIPLDETIPVAIDLGGFSATALPSPLPRGAETPERHVVTLVPAPAWTLRLEGALTVRPVRLPEGKVALATTAGTIRALDAATGESRWPPGASPLRVPGAIFRLPGVHATEEGAAAFIDQSGIRAVVALESGVLLPPGAEPGPLAPQFDLAVETASLARFGSTGGPGGPALLLTSRSGPPLLAAALAGPVHWPETSAAAGRLRERIGEPAGAPLHLPQERALFLCSRDGRLHRLLESGLPADTADLGTGPLTEGGALFHDARGERRLLTITEQGTLHAFSLPSGGGGGATRLWETDPLMGEAPAGLPALEGERIAVASVSGTLVVLDAADGRVLARREGRGGHGAVTAGPVLAGRTLLLPVGPGEGRSGGVLAFRIEPDRVAGPLWRDDPAAGGLVTALSAWREAGRLIVLYGAGRELRCLRIGDGS